MDPGQQPDEKCSDKDKDRPQYMDVPRNDISQYKDEPSFDPAAMPCSTSIKFTIPSDPIPPLERLSPKYA